MSFIRSDCNPDKGLTVMAFWPSFNRYVKAKWTGKRWLRFNELFGGYDSVEAPTKWKHLDEGG